MHAVSCDAAALPCSHSILSNGAIIQESYMMDSIADSGVLYVLPSGVSEILCEILVFLSVDLILQH